MSALGAAALVWLAASGAIDLAPAERGRLAGQTIERSGSGYRIVDVAGEGPPRVGVVERRGKSLWLVAGDEALELTGPLAVPRIAGPGYRVWIIGERHGQKLEARRLGVLRPPRRGATE